MKSCVARWVHALRNSTAVPSAANLTALRESLLRNQLDSPALTRPIHRANRFHLRRVQERCFGDPEAARRVGVAAIRRRLEGTTDAGAKDAALSEWMGPSCARAAEPIAVRKRGEPVARLVHPNVAFLAVHDQVSNLRVAKADMAEICLIDETLFFLIPHRQLLHNRYSSFIDHILRLHRFLLVLSRLRLLLLFLLFAAVR